MPLLMPNKPIHTRDRQGMPSVFANVEGFFRYHGSHDVGQRHRHCGPLCSTREAFCYVQKMIAIAFIPETLSGFNSDVCRLVAASKQLDIDRLSVHFYLAPDVTGSLCILRRGRGP